MNQSRESDVVAAIKIVQCSIIIIGNSSENVQMRSQMSDVAVHGVCVRYCMARGVPSVASRECRAARLASEFGRCAVLALALRENIVINIKTWRVV